MISIKNEDETEPETASTGFDFRAYFDGTTAASAVDDLFVTPFRGAADRAALAISSVGDAISDAALQGDYFLSPLDVDYGTNRVSFGTNGEPTTKNVALHSSVGVGVGASCQTQPLLSKGLPVDIQPRFDGTGIEIISNNNNNNNNNNDHNNGRDKNNDQQTYLLGSSIIRGSTLVFDPFAAGAEHGEGESGCGCECECETIEPMSLKVLRGKNLPFDRTRIRIGVFDREGSAIDQILGSTPPSSGETGDPIWGSGSSSWTVRASPSTEFLFTLLGEDAGEGREIEIEIEIDGDSNRDSNRDRDTNNRPAATLCARVLASDLLGKKNPNHWVAFQSEENPGSTSTIGDNSYGRIQVRLTRPAEARLHEQETCSQLSPGPGLPRVPSYAVRKMALYSCSPVMLNVYDVSNNPKIQTINSATKRIGYGGIFHAAIEIHGREYSFGGTADKNSRVSGVFQCAPKRCPMHHYRESVFLGDCELTSPQIQTILNGLRPQWPPRSYNLFRKNCAFFSRELAIELGVGDIPGWVVSLATTAETIEPYLYKLNAYLKQRTNTNSNSNSNSNTSNNTSNSNKVTAGATDANAKQSLTASSSSATTEPEPIHAHDNIEVYEVARNTQETLLDHAMAARIQRSFRALNGRRRGGLRRANALLQFRVLSVATTASA